MGRLRAADAEKVDDPVGFDAGDVLGKLLVLVNQVSGFLLSPARSVCRRKTCNPYILDRSSITIQFGAYHQPSSVVGTENEKNGPSATRAERKTVWSEQSIKAVLEVRARRMILGRNSGIASRALWIQASTILLAGGGGMFDDFQLLMILSLNMGFVRFIHW